MFAMILLPTSHAIHLQAVSILLPVLLLSVALLPVLLLSVTLLLVTLLSFLLLPTPLQLLLNMV